MRRGVLAGIVTALLSPALLGCSSDSPQAEPSSPPTTPTNTATSPSTSPPRTTPSTPAKTVSPPPLAKRETVPGSKAFVRFYIGAINTSIEATADSAVRRFSTTQCVTCRGIASSMEKIRRNHGFYRGGDWVVTSVSPIPLQTRARPILHTAITVTPGVWKRSPTDRERTIKAGKMYVDVHLSWAKSHWLVTEIVSA